mgnify:CR=1 FL=1|tara:strand:+ start:101 stop:925 length:825 start_codon:yes stop_codon:yes gene_type:complete
MNNYHLSLKIKKKILQTAFEKRKGHLGGSLSVLDILISLFTCGHLKLNKKDFIKKNNDKLILSKGHTAIALYALMEHLNISSYYKLEDFNSSNKSLLEHPTLTKNNLEISCETGALGHGLPISSGLAIANSKKKVVCVIGDGELFEGSNWEALFFIAAKKLTNLLIIVDCNNFITLGKISNILSQNNLKKKFQSFNFNVDEIDGHNFNRIGNSIKKFSKNKLSKPMVLLCKTIKGKGIIGMENTAAIHHGFPSQKQFEQTLNKIDKQIKSYEKF